MGTFYLVTHRSIHVPTRPSRAKTDICVYSIIYLFQRVYVSTESEIKYLKVPSTLPDIWQTVSKCSHLPFPFPSLSFSMSIGISQKCNRFLSKGKFLKLFTFKSVYLKMLSTHLTHRMLRFCKILISFQKESPEKSSSIIPGKMYLAPMICPPSIGLGLGCFQCQNEKFAFNVVIKSCRRFWNI